MGIGAAVWETSYVHTDGKLELLLSWRMTPSWSTGFSTLAWLLSYGCWEIPAVSDPNPVSNGVRAVVLWKTGSKHVFNSGVDK